VPVFADPVRLRQALSNLVANAVTHTPRGGTVEVRVREGSGGGDGGSSGAVFTVADTGPGIPPEHLPFVFDRCYRADRSRGRAAGGSGLGLAITRRLAEAHGGRVTAQSPPGSGAVFTLRLPPPPPCPAS
jgi:two-component system sensor histidine kinase BaeS